MSLQQQLTEIVGNAFEAEGIERSYGGVVVSQRPASAYYPCNGALPAQARRVRNRRRGRREGRGARAHDIGHARRG